jgi:hypothetical protein
MMDSSESVEISWIAISQFLLQYFRGSIYETPIHDIRVDPMVLTDLDRCSICPELKPLGIHHCISPAPPQDLTACGDSQILLGEYRPSVSSKETRGTTKCPSQRNSFACSQTCDTSCQPSRHNFTALSFNELEGLSFLSFTHSLSSQKELLSRTPCGKPSTTSKC